MLIICNMNTYEMQYNCVCLFHHLPSNIFCQSYFLDYILSSVTRWWQSCQVYSNSCSPSPEGDSCFTLQTGWYDINMQVFSFSQMPVIKTYQLLLIVSVTPRVPDVSSILAPDARTPRYTHTPRNALSSLVSHKTHKHF